MGFFDGYDHYTVSQDLDLAAWDDYVGTGQLKPDLNGAAHDLTRGFMRKNFWVMETQPGFVNWVARQQLPRPGRRPRHGLARHRPRCRRRLLLAMALRPQRPGGIPRRLRRRRRHARTLYSESQPARRRIRQGRPRPRRHHRPLRRRASSTPTTPAGPSTGSATTRPSIPRAAWSTTTAAIRALAQSVDIVSPTILSPVQTSHRPRPQRPHRPASQEPHRLRPERRPPRPRPTLRHEEHRQRPPAPAPARPARPSSAAASNSSTPWINTSPRHRRMGHRPHHHLGRSSSPPPPPTPKSSCATAKSNGWLDDQPAAITRKVGQGSITYIGAWLDQPLTVTFFKNFLAQAKVPAPSSPHPKASSSPTLRPERLILLPPQPLRHAATVALPSSMFDILHDQSITAVTLPPHGVSLLKPHTANQDRTSNPYAPEHDNDRPAGRHNTPPHAPLPRRGLVSRAVAESAGTRTSL